MNIIEKKQSICLNMIVKNESRIIVDTLTKLLKKIKWDYWVICDTGSTDNTRELITEFFEKQNIPGELFCDEWKDFGHNRTEALKKAFDKTDYVFIFDADDEICLDFQLPEVLDHDAYNFQFGSHHDHDAYVRTLMVNNRKLWKYVGVLHEVIVPDGHVPTTYKISGNYFVVSGRSGDRNTNNPDKYLKDAQVLEKAYYEALEKGDNIHERYAFYCANSYKDYGMNDKAIEWYKKTLTHNNWCQEKYICCLRLYNCYEALGQKESGFYYCVKSTSYDSERGEGLNHLITHYCCEGLNEIAFAYYQLIQDYFENRYLNEESNAHNHKLFVENNVLSFFLPYYMVIVCEKLKKHDIGLKMYEIVFTKKTRFIADFYVRCLLFNLRFFIDHLKPEKKSAFISLFNDYLQFLDSNGHRILEYDFMSDYHSYGVEPKYTLKLVQPLSSAELDKCKASRKVFFYSGFAGVKWNQTYSLTNALGGSETAVAYLTKYLPKDYEIYVGGEVEDEVVDNVHYVHQFKLPELFKNNSFHTVVISRYVGFFEMFPFYSSFQTFIWAHDTCFNAYGSQNMNDLTILKKWESRITGAVCLTQWHKEHMSNLYPILKDKIHIINNGVKVEMFKYPLTKTRNLFIYTSCAERGLDRLLELWPSILEKFPDAQLKISSYNDFPKNEGEIRMLETIQTFQNSVQHLGKLGPEQLYELMSTAEYWLYPTSWPETSCITALEMLKSEVICIYYPCAGLVNTMDSYGIAINRGEEISTIESLTEEKKQEMRLRGREYAETCSWENRGKTWWKMFQIESETTNIVLEITDDDNNNDSNSNYIKIVNLERRPDRKEEMTEKLKNHGVTNYEFIKAVDGKHLSPSVEVKRLFEGNDFNYRRGVLGCALSHFKLWKELTMEPLLNYYVILEDDIEFSDDFDKKLQYAMSEFNEKQMEYLYLGANSLRTVNADFDNLKCVRSDGEQGEGTYAYIISKSCAEKLLDYFNKNSMKRAIDFTPVYKSILDGIFYLNESIVHTFSIQHHGVHVDSDIQKDYDFVDMTGVGDLDSDDESCGLYEDYYQANYEVSK